MITSAANGRIKRIVALGQKARLRREEDCFLAEGSKMFLEAPKSWVKEVYVSEAFLAKCTFREVLETYSYEVVSDEVFARMSDTKTPQGILCVLQCPHYSMEQLLAKPNPFLVLLENLQDPGNLGTIFRTGEGAGIDGVIMTKETADLFNPKVIRATMGSVYRMPYLYVDDILSCIEELKRQNIAVYAAHLDNSVCYDMPDYRKGTAFLIGNEGNGLKRETADRASQYIKIPMHGQVESLNAAVATSILMYEAAKQRK